MSEYCCPYCFADGYLRKTINWPQNLKGNCSFCLKENQPLLEPHELKMDFQPVVDLYVHGGTKTLAEQLGQDWAIWSSKLKSDAQIRLLNAIFQKQFSKKHYCLRNLKKREREAIAGWKEFSQEIKYQNRFIHPEDIHNRLGLDILASFMNQIQLKKLPKALYRARINKDNYNRPLSLNKMGKPPVELAKNGRANPIGISYLYTGTTPKCAIHEVRPHIGAYVSVVDLRIKDPASIYIVDLRFQPGTISPFEIDELEKFSQIIPFLKILDTKMSQPISPMKSDLDYLPIQYLCEYIKQQKVDGIVYKSAACHGVKDYNIVFFSDEHIERNSVKCYHVLKNRIEFEKDV